MRARLALFLVPFLVACGGEEADARFRNVLLVTLDTTRADHLGAYGHAGAQTPTLDALAAEGVLFEQCLSTTPITLPSHTSILTGQYPFRHGVRNNGTHRAGEELETLAESLRDAGFATGAVISAFVLDARYGLDQGFDHYDDELASRVEAAAFMFRETKADDTTDRALRFLEENGDERWFLWVHYFDPHASYEPPPEYRERFPDAPYDGEISFVDAELGRLLASLDPRERERTLIVVTADHGESLGEHGESGHGMFLYDATTRVPLVFTHPEFARASRVPTAVSIVDVQPTVLDLLGLEGSAPVDGRSLAGVLLGGGELEPRAVYQEAMSPFYNHGWSDLRALRDDEHRWVRAPREELYALATDPGETRNLLPSADASAAPYREELERLLAGGERDARRAEDGALPDDEAAALEELGYVWTGDPEPDDGVRADPKDRIEAWEQTIRAYGLVQARRYAEAADVLRALLRDSPDSLEARKTLARCLDETGEEQAALDLLTSCLQLPGGRTSEVLIHMAEIERERGRAEWLALLRAARELQPPDPLVWVREGDWLREDGDVRGAIRVHREALEIDDRCADAWHGLGAAYQALGDGHQAERSYQRAVELDPSAFESWTALGFIAHQQLHMEEAERAFLESRRLRPNYVPNLVNLGNLYFRLERLGEAETVWREALDRRPGHFQANYNLGSMLVEQARPAEAAPLLRRATQARPNEFPPWLQLMIAARELEEYEESLHAAERMIAIDERSMHAYFGAAAACALLGRRSEALRFVERATVFDDDAQRRFSSTDPVIANLLASESP